MRGPKPKASLTLSALCEDRCMSVPRVYINNIVEYDWLVVLEFGRVDDYQEPGSWEGLSEEVGILRDLHTGETVGFKVNSLSNFDEDARGIEEIWDGPRFHSPQLGLPEATIGEIVLASRAFFDGKPSVNRELFNMALDKSGEEALDSWRRCLESGDGMAHYGLGYSLYEAGRFKEAYRHLRYYTEISPAGSWNWCWYGKAAEAIGEVDEARSAYERAIEIEEAGGEETDAGELLDQLDD